MFSFGKSLAGLLAGAAGALAASSAGAVTFKAYDQFNIAAGAVTAPDFAVGYLDAAATFTGALTDFTRFETACAGNAAIQCAATLGGDATPGVYKASGAYASGTTVFDPGELNLHPGPGGQRAGVQFVAPTAGTYRFQGSFSLNDTSPTGVALAGYVGTASAFAASLGGGLGATYLFDFEADLAADERVTFLVGPDGTYAYDSTGLVLNVSTGVPEPAAWAMMILGFGMAGGLFRRQARGALA